MTRYLSGLCVAGLGLCGGGWLVVAAVAFRGESGGRAVRVNVLTGAALVAVCCLSLVCWSCAWRRRLRADGVLAERFPLVSRREARRNRRALSRDVRRAGRLAERSARGARRAARRSSRLTASDAWGEAGAASVLGEGVALGVAAGGDEQYAAAVSHGVDAKPAGPKSTDVKLTGVSPTEGKPGERAAELIGELRAMLEPLLAAAGGQAALAPQAPVLAPPDYMAAAAPLVAPAPAAAQAPAARPLPVRSPFASELRPRMTAAEMAAPRARPAAPQPTPRPAPRSIPRLAPGVPVGGHGAASDGEDAWW